MCPRVRAPATLYLTRQCENLRRASSQATRDCERLPLRARKRYRKQHAKCQVSTNATICSQLRFANVVFHCTLLGIGSCLRREMRLIISSTQTAVSRGEVNQYTDESFACKSYLRSELVVINTSTRKATIATTRFCGILYYFFRTIPPTSHAHGRYGSLGFVL